MKKLIVMLLSTLVFINITTPKSTAIPLLKFTELHSISAKDGSKIKFYNAKDNIYITTRTPQSINLNGLKLLRSNPNGSKILVNRDNSLTKGYVPKNLTSISSTKIKLEYTSLKLIPKTIDALYSMVDAAKKNKVKGFIINSAYRNEKTQRDIFNANLTVFKKTSKTYAEAYEKTRKLVALPGNSEHQTGLAIDIFSINGRHRNDFAGTKEQLWLTQNSYKFGFIIRYPKDKTKETDANYEPWHIRYVGIALSSYLHVQNLCLDEFYDKIFAGNILKNNNYVFMKIKATQKIYIDESIKSKDELEPITKGTLLLTLKKD